MQYAHLSRDRKGEGGCVCVCVCVPSPTLSPTDHHMALNAVGKPAHRWHTEDTMHGTVTLMTHLRATSQASSSENRLHCTHDGRCPSSLSISCSQLSRACGTQKHKMST